MQAAGASSAEVFQVLAGAIQFAIFVWLIVMVVLDRRGFPRHWRMGLLFYGGVALLSLPVVVAKVFYFEPVSQQPEVEAVIHGVVSFVQLPIMVGVGLLTYVVAATEWQRIRHEALPLLTRRPRVPWRQIGVAGLIGLVYGGLTVGVFFLLDVKRSQWMNQLLNSYPDLWDAPIVLLGPLAFLMVCLPALTEEVTFRGALLGFFTRLGGRHRQITAFVIGAVVTSALFASLHLLNTNLPAAKFTQIFIFGLIAAEVTRRSCLEAAMACHLGLNIAALAAAPLMTG